MAVSSASVRILASMFRFSGFLSHDWLNYNIRGLLVHSRDLQPKLQRRDAVLAVRSPGYSKVIR